MAGNRSGKGLAKAASLGAERARQSELSAIDVRLRTLQAERVQEEGSFDSVIEALVPAIAAACAEGYLVSLSRVRGSGTIMLRIRVGEEWLDWFFAEGDYAEEVARELVRALREA